MYTIEKGVAVVNTASDYCIGHRYDGVPVKMFANAPKLAHVVVATLDDRVDVGDKVKIGVKNYKQKFAFISGMVKDRAKWTQIWDTSITFKFA